MSYLQKIYHESMFLLEKGILLDTFLLLSGSTAIVLCGNVYF